MTGRDSAKRDQDRVRIPLDPEEALRALLKVDPDAAPAEPAKQLKHPNPDQPSPGAK
jgi:hypothetical protein